jgi:hypothetical protein
MTANSKMKKRSTRRSEHDDSEAVTAYIESLEHPLKPVIETIRDTILVADNRITEGIKWNSPSFYCYGWFAAVNLHAKDTVRVVLHHGAKIRDNTSHFPIADTSQLLRWLSKDRAIARFTSTEDFQSKQAAFKKIIKQWADHQAQRADSTQTVVTAK